VNDYWCSKCNSTGKVLSDLSGNMVDCPQCGFLRRARDSSPQSPPRSNIDYGTVIGAVVGVGFVAVILALVIWTNVLYIIVPAYIIVSIPLMIFRGLVGVGTRKALQTRDKYYGN